MLSTVSCPVHHERDAMMTLAAAMTVAAACAVILPVCNNAWTELMKAPSWLIAGSFRPDSMDLSAFRSLAVRLLISPLVRVPDRSAARKAVNHAPGLACSMRGLDTQGNLGRYGGRARAASQRRIKGIKRMFVTSAGVWPKNALKSPAPKQSRLLFRTASASPRDDPMTGVASAFQRT